MLLSQPHHYRPGTEEQECGNCGAYLYGWCRMFRLLVRRGYVCDSWYPRP